MADPVVSQLVAAASTTATTTVNFTAQAAGTLLVLLVAADDYKTGDPSGWTAPTGGAQETNLGHYMWYKIASGSETSVAYTIGSASGSAHILLAVTNIDGASPLDVSNGAFANGDTNYTTPAVTTTAGQRLAIASIGTASGGGVVTGHGAWTNGYTEVSEVVTTVGTSDRMSAASLLFSGGAATSTNATFTGGSSEKSSAIIAVFKGTGSTALTINAGVDQGIYTGQVANIAAIASGGSGTKTYAWTKVSGPAGTFGNAALASTTFTPSAAGTYNLRCTVTDSSGTAQDDMQIVVTDPSASATVLSVTTETSWTVVPSGTSTAALSDTSGATYVQSSANPTAQVLEVVLEPITEPGAGVDLVVTVGCDRVDSGSGTLDAQLYEGGSASGTLISTVTGLAIPAGTTGTDVAGSVIVTFPSADVASVTDWTQGLSIKFSVTAAV